MNFLIVCTLFCCQVQRLYAQSNVNEALIHTNLLTQGQTYQGTFMIKIPVHLVMTHILVIDHSSLRTKTSCVLRCIPVGLPKSQSKGMEGTKDAVYV